MKSKITLIIAFILLYGGFFFGCVGPAPVLEYNLAQESLVRAKYVGATKFASGHWHQANRFYDKAKKHYENREYSQARNFFEKARLSAEKAENLSRVKKFKSGEGP
ncbi:MAG: DUF4398 domain-containing protein [Bdellovibrionaceae bacterium]|jgi:hypothetical protein|nr:DUF4398 domain-containing protein [Pseudobdellovibrionaceae bacterium]